MTIIECATGRFPFVAQDGKSPIRGFWELLNHIKSQDPPALSTADGFSPEMCDFVKCCLQKDPNRRASTKDLLIHPFILQYKPSRFPDVRPDWYVEHTERALQMAEKSRESSTINTEQKQKEKLLANLQL